jgi:sec-independent protein translocase protein TatA
MIAILEGSDLWIVLIVVVVLFGGSQIPKLARSIGSASSEFKKGIEEGAKPTDETTTSQEDTTGTTKA